MRRPNASRVKQKDSVSKVTIPCHFGARQRFQHLASGCQLFISKVCHPLFVPQALSSSFFNHTCMCTLCAWGLLWSCVHITHWFVTAGFQCEEHENPADFFLDVITRCENPPSAVLENQGEQLTNTTLLNKLYLTSDLLWLAMHDSMCSKCLLLLHVAPPLLYILSDHAHKQLSCTKPLPRGNIGLGNKHEMRNLSKKDCLSLVPKPLLDFILQEMVDSVSTSLVPRLSCGKEEREPGTHCWHMCPSSLGHLHTTPLH